MGRAHAFHQRALDLGIAPASDPGFDIGRDVRRGGVEDRRVECQSAGQRLLGDDVAGGIARGVAIAAGHDGVDEIIAALGRRFRPCAVKAGKQQHAACDSDPKHDISPWPGGFYGMTPRGRATVSPKLRQPFD
jgi:hypothetical protein